MVHVLTCHICFRNPPGAQCDESIGAFAHLRSSQLSSLLGSMKLNSYHYATHGQKDY